MEKRAKPMRQLLGLELFVLCLIFNVCFALNCNVSLPRLLLGDQYSSSTPDSTESALIIFDTIDECKYATLLRLNNSSFTFQLKEIVPQFVNEELSHDGESKEFVSYSKYSIIFSISADPGRKYSVGFQGDTSLESSISSLSYSFVLPPVLNKFPALLAQQSPPKILFYGDQDLTERGQKTLDFLQKLASDNITKENKNSLFFDSFIFLGDYAYEFYSNNGKRGDSFLEKFAPLSFSFPLVMTPGNHEHNLNFTLFNQKFRMPGFSLDNLNNYNSFNIGNIHFLHVNLDYFGLSDSQSQQKMLNWVANDLQAINRTITPWVIAVGHKLINCYDALYNGNPQCMKYITKFEAFDTIFGTLGVDMFITGHEHYNQVMAPMFNKTILPYSFNKDSGHLSYSQGGYVSIIQGNGGSYWEAADYARVLDVSETLKEASLFLNQKTFGFGWIQAINDTYLEYHSVDVNTGKDVAFFKVTSNHSIIISEKKKQQPQSKQSEQSQQNGTSPDPFSSKSQILNAVWVSFFVFCII